MKKFDNNLIYLLNREKKIILGGVLIGLVAFVFYLIFFYVPLFNTSCKIFVKNIQKQDVVTTYNGGSTITSESGYSNPLFNLYEVLKSENVSDRVYEAVKNKYPEDLAKFNVNSRQDFYQTYQKIISSDVEPSSDILKVTLLWPDAKHAPVVLQEVIKQFKIENLNLKKSIEVNKRTFLDKQTEDITKSLDDVRKKIKDYRISTKLTDLTDESSNLVYARVDLQRQQELLKSQAAYNSSKLKEYASQLDFPNVQTALRATGIGEDPYLIKVSQDLSVAQQNYAMLRAKYTDKYPDVIAAKSQIELLKQNINKRKKDTAKHYKISRGIYDPPSAQVVTNMAVAQAEAVSLNSQIKALDKGIAQIASEEAKLPVKQLGFEDLKKQEEAFSDAYKNVKEKQLEAKIKENEVVDNLIPLNSATKPLPISTIVLTKLLGFLAVGALLGLCYAYLKQGIENKWSSIDEVELITGAPVLGVVPWLKDINSDNSRVILDAAYSNISNEIISKAYLNDAFVLAFISTSQSKNKSIMAKILASKVAKLCSSVMLIDLVGNTNQEFDIINLIEDVNKNLRFHNKDLNSISDDELTQLVASPLSKAVKQQFVTTKGIEHRIDILELSRESLEINDYLAAKGFSLILKYLKQNFELIFINAPHGLVLLPEIQTIKHITDASILISAMNTNRDGLINVVENYERTGDKILGIITREENSEFEKAFEILGSIGEQE